MPAKIFLTMSGMELLNGDWKVKEVQESKLLLSEWTFYQPLP